MDRPRQLQATPSGGGVGGGRAAAGSRTGRGAHTSECRARHHTTHHTARIVGGRHSALQTLWWWNRRADALPTWAVVSSFLVTEGVCVRRVRAGQAAASTNTRRTRERLLMWLVRALQSPKTLLEDDISAHLCIGTEWYDAQAYPAAQHSQHDRRRRAGVGRPHASV